jgi:RimJ/RimL family protein N-acetyltransferase
MGGLSAKFGTQWKGSNTRVRERVFAIRTDRLLLRDFCPADLPAYAHLRARPASIRFSPEEDAHAEKAEELLRLFLAWSEERPRLRYQLAVVLPSRGLIGSVGVRVASVSERQGSFGCELDPCHWGCGYAREAARAVIGYGFCELGLHRVYAETLEQNAAAINLAEGLGMRREGTLRENRRFGGRWWNTTILSVLESEWSDSPTAP